MSQFNEVDEILGTNSNYNTQYNTRGQNNWAEQQNKDRQEIYKTMDKMALIVGNDAQKFKEYLDIQSKFDKYSVGNCLVILEKAPNSTRIKDKNSWLEKGIELKENAKGIKILEPVRNDIGITYYNPKTVYDISQTNAQKTERTINYGDRILLEALMHNCDVPRVAVDKLPNGEIGSKYDKENNILYVCKKIDRETLFQTLIQEMGNIEMKYQEDEYVRNYASYCTSYMICKKYGIDVSNFKFENITKEIKPLNARGIKKELDIIRSNFEKVNSRMLDYFDMKKKEKNKTIHER